MELTAFGTGGMPVIFFPTRTARFFDYENWGVLLGLRDRIKRGELFIVCVDSVDSESIYCNWKAPRQRIEYHMQYEKYIVHEVVPFAMTLGHSGRMVAAGCSMGAYHAVNIALRRPDIFRKTIGMSGRYDLTKSFGVFRDLFDGYYDLDIYFNTPTHFISKMKEGKLMDMIRSLDVTISIGEEDAFLQNNRDLSELLAAKAINNKLYIWEGEAHSAREWKKMLELYF